MPLLILLLVLLGFQSLGAECQDLSPIHLGAGTGPITTTLNNGNFIITWNKQTSAFLFNANGSLAKQFAIQSSELATSIVTQTDDTFIYAWSRYQNDVLQPIVQRYHEDGTPYSPQFTIVSGNLTSVYQLVSSVAALDDGGFVIIWDGDNVYDEKDENNEGWTVAQSYARVFNSNNTPRGSQFVIYKGNSTSRQIFPIVFGQENDGFGILWNEVVNSNLTASQIYGQLYHSNGAKIGDTFLIDDSTLSQLGQAAARLKSGQIVVTWQSYDATTNKFYIYARILHPTGKPKGQTFLVQTNGYSPYGVLPPSVTALTSGRFVIVWLSGDDRKIYFQVYKRNGNPYQDPVLVNPANMTEGDNSFPSITGMSDGGFVITWPYCNDDCEIYAQRYDGNGKVVAFVQEKKNILEELEFDEI